MEPYSEVTGEGSVVALIHVPGMERPEEFDELVLGFLESV